MLEIVVFIFVLFSAAIGWAIGNLLPIWGILLTFSAYAAVLAFCVWRFYAASSAGSATLFSASDMSELFLLYFALPTFFPAGLGAIFGYQQRPC